MVNRRDQQLEWELDYGEAKRTLSVLSGLPHDRPTADHRVQIVALLVRLDVAVREALEAM